MKRIKASTTQLSFAFMLAAIVGPGFVPNAYAECKECPQNESKGRREGFNQPLILSGIKTIRVAVGEVDETLKEKGASQEHLVSRLKEELSTTHATIIDAGEACCKNKGGNKAADNAPILYLKVRSVSDDAKVCVYTINLSLVEKSRIARNHKDIMASVWSKDLIGKIQTDAVAELDGKLDALMKEFRRDYLLANSADIAHPDTHDITNGRHGQKKPRYLRK
ncbi:MAG: hypothetical protein HC888_11160 [Candidatus Competibacteraceae bacterium]|nr:hypothetical protein [Candidatus Competibacteraceae bacterium]